MTVKSPKQTIFYTIEKAIKVYRKFAQKEIHKTQKDITLNQVLLLMQFNENPDESQVVLASALFKDYASITRMIELMVKNGYLKRTTHNLDRRRSKISITNKGKSTLAKLFPVIAENRKQALNGLNDEEEIMLKKLLNKIIDNCK